MKSMFDLSGKVALVTGGRRGLGLAMSEGLVAAGAKLACVDIASEYDELRKRVESHGGELLFDCYGLPLIETRLVHTASEAAAFAAEFDGPVALKAVAAELVHKTEVGAVRLKLLGGDEVRAAAREERMAVEEAGMRFEGFAVQPMAPDGVELLMGVVHDANFGPVIVVGAGGTRAELFGDIAVRITPLTDLDAREMLSSLRVYSLLQGFRGQPKCDLAAVEDALLGLSLLVESHPEVAELDANPLIASSAGAVIVDARVRVHPPEAERPLFALS